MSRLGELVKLPSQFKTSPVSIWASILSILSAEEVYLKSSRTSKSASVSKLTKPISGGWWVSTCTISTECQQLNLEIKLRICSKPI